MKTIFLLAINLFLTIGAAQAQNNFDKFFVKFRAAVMKKDKSASANFSSFPVSMQYGVKSVKNRAEFLRRYNEIFSGEADAARCFENTEPVFSDNYYRVYCTFKSYEETSDDRPILYLFKNTKKGWRFVGLDNINE